MASIRGGPELPVHPYPREMFRVWDGFEMFPLDGGAFFFLNGPGDEHRLCLSTQTGHDLWAALPGVAEGQRRGLEFRRLKQNRRSDRTAPRVPRRPRCQGPAR